MSTENAYFLKNLLNAPPPRSLRLARYYTQYYSDFDPPILKRWIRPCIFGTAEHFHKICAPQDWQQIVFIENPNIFATPDWRVLPTHLNPTQRTPGPSASSI